MSTSTAQRPSRQLTRTGRVRLTCVSDVMYRWADRIDFIAPEREHFERSSLICESDSLFHYGRHFELARIVRDKRGRARLVLLNGDLWRGGSGFGPSTSQRQGEVRDLVRRTSDVPNMVVPFSALEAAGIDFATIAPIHVRDDRWTHEERSSIKRPAKLTTMIDPSGATTTETQWSYNYETRRSESREVEVPMRVPDPNRTRPFSNAHGWCEDGATRGEDGVWRWTLRRHWLGDCIFRARTSERRTRRATAEELAAEAAWLAWQAEERRLQDHSEELARKVRALDSLYPYRSARRSRRHSDFEGDYRLMTRNLFAAEGFRQQAERASDALHEHRMIAPQRPNVRNGRVPVTVTRWATFLSSFDYQEPAPLYFLCELPYGAKPNTVDEAIEALKPPEVVAAEARGLRVVRQGDLFAIPTRLTKRQLRRMRRGNFTDRMRVLGTNHSVAEGVICKGGAVLGRGIMRHEPDGWRAPDHISQTLGDKKTWHLLVRNTVPRSH